MKLRGEVVYFKSAEPWYSKEKSGIKNNTVRILSESEYIIMQCSSIAEIDSTKPIVEESFRRKVTDITEIGEICGKHIVVFTWKRGKEKV